MHEQDPKGKQLKKPYTFKRILDNGGDVKLIETPFLSSLIHFDIDVV